MDTMNPGSNNPGHSSNADGEKHKQVDRGVREMVSVLTHRLADLQQVHKDGSGHPDQDEAEHGVRIITLAGSNTGATMRSELDEKSSPRHGLSLGEQEGLSTYVNSNFQAINNSIMMGGSYNTNDPGVHMDISDFIDHHGHNKPNKHGKKGMKKEKEASHSDKNAQHSD